MAQVIQIGEELPVETIVAEKSVANPVLLQVTSLVDMNKRIDAAEPVQIVIPDNTPTCTQPKAESLRGGGGSAIIAIVACFLLLCIMGLLIGTIVGFTSGNAAAGIGCLVVLILCCCGGGGGGGAAASSG
ncbi:unnamed protein product [Adineta ricciae]|uniref:Uncharacterized protein n=1 Tax=Adineta ricciae TaxID=249248 RepID=A0A816G494_ADIRI|nr:unnamed protein product [Adineta ricciae]CAF1670091.1 unnamed protein product [Adineta ricciae]